MKNYIYTALLLFVSKSVFSQNDIFDIARKGTVEDIEIIVKNNPTAVDSTNKEGFSPLILACYRGNNDVAAYLIKVIKDVNYTSEMGTALMACAAQGNNETAKLLLEKNANPNISDRSGNSALLYAVQFKNIELVKLLLEYKADKTQRDGLGKTAFEYAVFSNNQTIINLLK